MVKTAEEARHELRVRGYSCSLVNVRFVKPIDEELLMQIAKEHRLVVTMEENVRTGGFGDHVLEYYNDIGSSVRVVHVALPDEYIEHGNVDVLRRETGIDAETVIKRIIAEVTGMEKQQEK